MSWDQGLDVEVFLESGCDETAACSAVAANNGIKVWALGRRREPRQVLDESEEGVVVEEIPKLDTAQDVNVLDVPRLVGRFDDDPRVMLEGGARSSDR